MLSRLYESTKKFIGQNKYSLLSYAGTMCAIGAIPYYNPSTAPLISSTLQLIGLEAVTKYCSMTSSHYIPVLLLTSTKILLRYKLFTDLNLLSTFSYEIPYLIGIVNTVVGMTALTYKIKFYTFFVVSGILSVVAPLIWFVYRYYFSDSFTVIMDAYQRIADGSQAIDVTFQGVNVVSYPIKKAIKEEELETVAPKNVLYEHAHTGSCGICIEDIKEKQLFRCLPKCKHTYHCECVDKWFFVGHYECPLCRTSII